MELERILGIRNGSAGKVSKDLESHNVTPKTQEDLAEQLKMSKMQLTRYKKLLDLVPELQSAVEEGKISATNAGNMRLLCFCLHPKKVQKNLLS